MIRTYYIVREHTTCDGVTFHLQDKMFCFVEAKLECAKLRDRNEAGYIDYFVSQYHPKEMHLWR